MTSVVRSAAAAAMVVMLLAGSAAVAYAAWMRPAADGDAALADGRYEQALASYAAAETRFDRIAAAKELFADDYGHVMANRLWILHRLERYDEAVDTAQRAPESAAPHFWSGCAFFEKARAEEKPDMRLGWLTPISRMAVATALRSLSSCSPSSTAAGWAVAATDSGGSSAMKS